MSYSTVGSYFAVFRPGAVKAMYNVAAQTGGFRSILTRAVSRIESARNGVYIGVAFAVIGAVGALLAASMALKSVLVVVGGLGLGMTILSGKRLYDVLHETLREGLDRENRRPDATTSGLLATLLC